MCESRIAEISQAGTLMPRTTGRQPQTGRCTARRRPGVDGRVTIKLGKVGKVGLGHGKGQSPARKMVKGVTVSDGKGQSARKMGAAFSVLYMVLGTCYGF